MKIVVTIADRPTLKRRILGAMLSQEQLEQVGFQDAIDEITVEVGLDYIPVDEKLRKLYPQGMIISDMDHTTIQL